ncbi:MAG: hypothetical protein A3J81_02000 [Nitrospirae bacterium RIFOXYB2_FULL_43_5]|nr:MAG: hypothetical protein A2067_01850 [Deltaproteobacteria bacterium GWB2_42_7]OGP44731.1 MAG: hypothetical protein A2090_08780 [Deltaproteobacteria bacterium GWD2_42_10]OGP47375.1 MAG: hypothetical protein A2022_03770 [Deltaproteobacteria bacterium GWF2_42_12]OGQ76900.1 MAG: hypothetical protein A2235_02855 [Deltaproteobacteria bacterium RIFOXYA2_FULL_42_10]OGW73398.1 MAG: hypothetical protein A3J81_02000 [Nitrospirae bacterium RIFOXYB2_FULL_43_5]
MPAKFAAKPKWWAQPPYLLFLLIINDFRPVVNIFVNPKNAVAFFDKHNLWPNTASNLAV